MVEQGQAIQNIPFHLGIINGYYIRDSAIIYVCMCVYTIKYVKGLRLQRKSEVDHRHMKRVNAW